MLIRLKKIADGSASLSVERDDGTVTWQRASGGQAQFFPRHDLTHYAVESVLRRRESFFGLLAVGWDITDFEKPYRRGAVPLEGVASEVLVGLLDLERSAGVPWSAPDVNASIIEYFAVRGLESTPLITEEDLARIRALRAELFARWTALAPGETLELAFPPPSP